MRIRRVDNQKEYDNVLDDYITLGYKVEEQGEKNAVLIKNKFGNILTHLILLPIAFIFGFVLFALTYLRVNTDFGGFCLLLGWISPNTIYVLYNLQNSDKVNLKLEEEVSN